MKTLVGALLLLICSGCVTDVARPVKPVYLHVAATSVTAAERAIAKKFFRKTRIRVDLILLTADTITRRAVNDRYNPGFDVLITEDPQVLYALSRRRLLTKVDNTRWFRKMIRQFNTSDKTWLATAHDPLVASGYRDSTGGCRFFNNSQGVTTFNTLGIASPAYGKFYQPGIATDESRRFLVMPLSYLLSRPEVQKNHTCWSYVQTSKRYVSTFVSISEHRYSRNHEAAQQFLDFYQSCSEYVARARKMQSTRRKGWSSPSILKYQIRRNPRFDR